ncbi:MAG TPA: hypothetical protein VME43_05470 [Bryobacteraceae bacterium]|nr:hypothetical protein [Bryobacteraceae bacterium]
MDEIGDTDGAEIRCMPACLIDFEIAAPDAGSEIDFDPLVRFNAFGDETREFILEKAYPKLNQALATVAEIETKDPAAAQALWAEALAFEKNCVHHEPVSADTEIGRRIQRQTGMSGAVANRVVRRAGMRLLKSSKTDLGPKQ